MAAPEHQRQVMRPLSQNKGDLFTFAVPEQCGLGAQQLDVNLFQFQLDQWKLHLHHRCLYLQNKGQGVGSLVPNLDSQPA